MSRFHKYQLPGETPAYRQARDELLAAEIDLRRLVADVARKRQALPDSGPLHDDYVFQQADHDVTLSSLFQSGHNTLVLYSFMFAPGKTPCPMCVAFLDSLNGSAPQLSQRISLAVVARNTVAEIGKIATTRGWNNLRMLSSGRNSYNRDYLGENAEGVQMPMLNVFHQRDNKIVHTYATELMLAKSEPGQDPRHLDMLWPIWNMLDLTPDGRGDWYPA